MGVALLVAFLTPVVIYLLTRRPTKKPLPSNLSPGSLGLPSAIDRAEPGPAARTAEQLRRAVAAGPRRPVRPRPRPRVEIVAVRRPDSVRDGPRRALLGVRERRAGAEAAPAVPAAHPGPPEHPRVRWLLHPQGVAGVLGVQRDAHGPQHLPRPGQVPAVAIHQEPVTALLVRGLVAPFGGGQRLCAGIEFARVETLVTSTTC